MRRTATPFVLLLALGITASVDATACPGSQQACAAPSTKATATAATAATAATSTGPQQSCAAPSAKATAVNAVSAGSPKACGATAATTATAGSSCCAMPKSNVRSASQAGKPAKVARPAKKVKQTPASRTTAKAAPAVAPAVPAAGMRAFLDPETGVIGGMPSELAGDALAGIGEGAAGAPIETVLPDGSIMVDLQGGLEHYLVLTVGPDGKRSMQCATDPSHVHAAPAPASAPQPEVR